MHTFESWLAEGLAVELCGFSRSTIDMDILVSTDSENVENMIHCLGHFGEGSAKELTPDDFGLQEGCMRVNEDFPLDIFTLMSGKKYEDLLSFSRTVELSGQDVRHLSPEGIILVKEQSNRPKDRLDVEAMRRLLK